MPFVKAIAKSELKPNQGRCVTLEGKQIAIFNMDGQYLAIDDLCTHADASLADGGVFKDEQGRCLVECPWHGARFDLKTGAALTLPAVTPVKTYPVREAGDALEVEI
jgi:3-phenylpropionate/trans-cinnamate dioxygenase ferredoxin component